MSVVKIVCCLLLMCHLSEGKRSKGNRAADSALRVKEPYVSSSDFSLFLGDDDTCTLDPLQLHTLTSCGFNSSNPLIIITHGWSVDGIMENWVNMLAQVLKTHLGDINVIITDWMSLACQHYPKAAQSTRTIGKDIAHLLQVLQQEYQYPLRKAHLIGYSLGAHISGFAGSYLEGPEKIGRITGLDPAGPFFEGMSPTDRLSPDDAEFVDAIHTFTRERMGLSVGIKQDVAHYDFYPNGGHFQPGCELTHILKQIAHHGVLDLQQTVKCAHERAVRLFMDSILNKDKQSKGYRCSNSEAFDKGLCLDCRKNRCNTLGYYIKKVRTGTPKRLFLKTGGQMPYKLYHYQFRIQFINQMADIEPSLTIFLTGTKDESGELTFTFPESIAGNTSFSFLVALERDLGELMMLRMRWERSDMLKTTWSDMLNIILWGVQEEKPWLSVGRISVKSGETQERTFFCAMANDGQHIEKSQDKDFVRCQEQTPKLHRRKHN
ncbi:hepatic triacylglycerol lipase [Salarias fasciatus]|uniref:Hepatic triacylglycerol lipase n=1 Tax=Salarias fasciatus TaxID=181472 RepID=A0A672FBW9_SALFA|nr:hepatic triacylglycerol lipase [Salarias fasciatus]